MRYIKTIQLHNFQGYKDETINLEPGLNILLGSSDSGKSTILRAISFVLYNAPRAKTLIHYGEKETRVSLTFSDNVKVTRILSDERNAYEVVDEKGKKLPAFNKIDKAIPEEVKKFLNNPPEDDFNGFISYADQFSKMFLVDLSPTELPRSLSNLTGVETLEEAAKELMQNYKAIEKQTKADEKEYTKYLDEYHSYDLVDELEAEIDKVKQKYTKLADLQAKYDEYSKYEVNIDHKEAEECLILIDDQLNVVDKALLKIKELQAKLDLFDQMKIFNLVVGSNFNPKDIDNIDTIIKNIDKSLEKCNLLSSNLTAYETYSKIEKDFELLREKGIKHTEEFKQLQNKVEESQKELDEYLKFLVDENIVCETCGSILK